MLFKDRYDAGQKLANILFDHKIDNPYVMALPRGGVPVGYEIAKRLKCALDVVVVRKLGVPGHSEFAFGAIAPNNISIIRDNVVFRLGITPEEIQKIRESETKEMERRIKKYRGSMEYPDLSEKNVVITDDGIATGATFEAAIEYVKTLHPQKIIMAIPVAAPDTLANLFELVDETIYLHTPSNFSAVGSWYENFGQTTDEEVVYLLQKSKSW